MHGTGGSFTAIASIDHSINLEDFNNTETYSKFFLNIDSNVVGTQEFALDDAGMEPGLNDGNDIPTLTAIRGGGIGFTAAGSGSFAMKFQLVRPDTFYGVRAYFGSANTAADPIRISLFSGNTTSNIPLGTLSTLDAHRGPNFDAFNSYLFQTPMPLTPGTYWVSVSQLGTDNMELGGCISRGGAEVVKEDPFQISPQIRTMYGPLSANAPWYGTQWGNGPDDNNGDVSTSWAVEAIAGSGGWAPILPASGWSPEMSNFGSPFSSIMQPQFKIISNQLVDVGIYAPMIRPIIGQKPTSAVAITHIAEGLTVEPNFPNPFDPTAKPTSIAFSLPAQNTTFLTICNVLGSVVRTLVNENLSEGAHNVFWDGRDEKGALVPAGTYLVVLTSGGDRATMKIIVAK